MLIILPSHLRVSGITTWAVRTVRLLRAAGERAGLLVHASSNDAVPAFLEPYVVGVCEDERPIDQLNGRFEHLLPAYMDALEHVMPTDGRPCVIAPGVPGDCYGVVAALSQTYRERLRVVSWLHADNAYDTAVAAHYEPMIHGFVPVSTELVSIARSAMPARATDIHRIPHSVDRIDAPARPPLRSRPIRLVYTGRVVVEQKRSDSFPPLVARLRELEVPFDLRIVGDGPHLEALQAAIGTTPEVKLIGAVPPTAVSTHLAWADAWVLPSSYEGQSVAMLEAMAHGCVPIVTRIKSGIAGVIEHRVRGMIADADENSAPDIVGAGLADQIADAANNVDLDSMSTECQRFIAEHHDPAAYTAAVLELIARVRLAAPRPWPTDRPAAFTSGATAGGTTPSDAATRLDELLTSLAGHRIAIYGAGRHTIDLAAVLARSPAQIVGILDDHADHTADQPEPTLWGWPILKPSCAHQLGATDVVLSSWLHEQSLWNKRSTLEQQGLRVHRLYTPETISAT